MIGNLQPSPISPQYFTAFSQVKVPGAVSFFHTRPVFVSVTVPSLLSINLATLKVSIIILLSRTNRPHVVVVGLNVEVHIAIVEIDDPGAARIVGVRSRRPIAGRHCVGEIGSIDGRAVGTIINYRLELIYIW